MDGLPTFDTNYVNGHLNDPIFGPSFEHLHRDESRFLSSPIVSEEFGLPEDESSSLSSHLSEMITAEVEEFGFLHDPNPKLSNLYDPKLPYNAISRKSTKYIEINTSKPSTGVVSFGNLYGDIFSRGLKQTKYGGSDSIKYPTNRKYIVSPSTRKRTNNCKKEISFGNRINEKVFSRERRKTSHVPWRKTSHVPKGPSFSNIPNISHTQRGTHEVCMWCLGGAKRKENCLPFGADTISFGELELHAFHSSKCGNVFCQGNFFDDMMPSENKDAHMSSFNDHSVVLEEKFNRIPELLKEDKHLDETANSPPTNHLNVLMDMVKTYDKQNMKSFHNDDKLFSRNIGNREPIEMSHSTKYNTINIMESSDFNAYKCRETAKDAVLHIITVVPQNRISKKLEKVKLARNTKDKHVARMDMSRAILRIICEDLVPLFVQRDKNGVVDCSVIGKWISKVGQSCERKKQRLVLRKSHRITKAVFTHLCYKGNRLERGKTVAGPNFCKTEYKWLVSGFSYKFDLHYC